jgi:hypothetical protein
LIPTPSWRISEWRFGVHDLFLGGSIHWILELHTYEWSLERFLDGFLVNCSILQFLQDYRFNIIATLQKLSTLQIRNRAHLKSKVCSVACISSFSIVSGGQSVIVDNLAILESRERRESSWWMLKQRGNHYSNDQVPILLRAAHNTEEL